MSKDLERKELFKSSRPQWMQSHQAFTYGKFYAECNCNHQHELTLDATLELLTDKKYKDLSSTSLSHSRPLRFPLIADTNEYQRVIVEDNGCPREYIVREPFCKETRSFFALPGRESSIRIIIEDQQEWDREKGAAAWTAKSPEKTPRSFTAEYPPINAENFPNWDYYKEYKLVDSFERDSGLKEAHVSRNELPIVIAEAHPIEFTENQWMDDKFVADQALGLHIVEPVPLRNEKPIDYSCPKRPNNFDTSSNFRETFETYNKLEVSQNRFEPDCNHADLIWDPPVKYYYDERFPAQCDEFNKELENIDRKYRMDKSKVYERILGCRKREEYMLDVYGSGAVNNPRYWQTKDIRGGEENFLYYIRNEYLDRLDEIQDKYESYADLFKHVVKTKKSEEDSNVRKVSMKFQYNPTTVPVYPACQVSETPPAQKMRPTALNTDPQLTQKRLEAVQLLMEEWGISSNDLLSAKRAQSLLTAQPSILSPKMKQAQSVNESSSKDHRSKSVQCDLPEYVEEALSSCSNIASTSQDFDSKLDLKWEDFPCQAGAHHRVHSVHPITSENSQHLDTTQHAPHEERTLESGNRRPRPNRQGMSPIRDTVTLSSLQYTLCDSPIRYQIPFANVELAYFRALLPVIRGELDKTKKMVNLLFDQGHRFSYITSGFLQRHRNAIWKSRFELPLMSDKCNGIVVNYKRPCLQKAGANFYRIAVSAYNSLEPVRFNLEVAVMKDKPDADDMIHIGGDDIIKYGVSLNPDAWGIVIIPEIARQQNAKQHVFPVHIWAETIIRIPYFPKRCKDEIHCTRHLRNQLFDYGTSYDRRGLVQPVGVRQVTEIQEPLVRQRSFYLDYADEYDAINRVCVPSSDREIEGYVYAGPTPEEISKIFDYPGKYH